MDELPEYKKLFFKSPEDCVRKIKQFLFAEDWAILARYYDLSRTRTDLKYEDLHSGKFFVRTEEPEVKHPGTSWKYKHPFDPGHNFSHVVQSNDGTITVFVSREIEDGFDKPVISMQFFDMVKSDEGYRLLPGL